MILNMNPQIPLFTCGFKPHFIETEQGITSYYDLGTSTAPCVVLVPGYLCSALMYRDLALHLVDKGFRIIMYDTYGTGGSIKQNDEKYNLDTFVSQLESVITNTGIVDLSLIGYSMGGLIAASFAKSHKSMIKKLLLISPAGVKVFLGPPNILKIMRTPFIGPKYFDFFYDKMILDAVKVNFCHPEKPEYEDDIQFLYLHIYSSWCSNPSFSQAACGIMRHFQFSNQEEIFKSLSDISITVILANLDGCVLIEQSEKFWKSQNNVDLTVLQEAGHWGIYEQKKQVFDIIDKAFC